MRAIFAAACLLVLLSACDRRDDPDVPSESQGVANPPGDAVGSTDGTMAPHHPPESTLEPTMPDEVPAQCSGLTGGELAQCVKENTEARAEPPVPSARESER